MVISHEVDAVYDNGTFIPVTPIAIPEGTQVHLRVEEKTAHEPAAKMMTQAELKEFVQMMAALPLEGPDDGFSGADHDKLLYGQP